MELFKMNDLINFFKNKKVLITGHTGFKGSWLSQILINFGAVVVGYSLKAGTQPNLFEALNLDKNVKTYFEDINNFKKLKEVIEKEKPEIIFHLAAQAIVRTAYDEPLKTYETNVMGTANLLEVIKELGFVKSVVMITTDKVYENKNWIWAYRENDELGGYDPYSSSKTCAEFVINSYIKSFFNLADFGFKHSTLIAVARAGNVIGGGDWSKDRLIPDIVKSIFEKEESIVLRNPDSVRPWQHVLEPLFGYLLLSKKLYEKDTSFVGAWNFAPNEENNIPVIELLRKSISILGKGEHTICKSNDIKHEAKLLKLDSTKAKTFLRWKPLLDIDKSLLWTFLWYKDYYSKKDILLLTNNQIKSYFGILENGR